MSGYRSIGVVLAIVGMTAVVAAEPPPATGLTALFPDGIADAKGNAVALASLQGKLIGIYFSAHWCGPCRLFTPELIKYREANADSFEVVFVSSDRSAEGQVKYMDSTGMQWPAVPWGSASAQALKSKYGVHGIPKLVLINDQGELLTGNGRLAINSKLPPAAVSAGTVVEESFKCSKCDRLHQRHKLVVATEDGQKINL